ncbi:MAG TPA: hypothetical protein DD429_07700 [Clostridiaceae bacterium]|jgi:hypothetical protein|nr:hypothetical protein [Clostridiaceae bacterium]
MVMVKLMIRYYINTAIRSFKALTKNWQALFYLIVYFLLLYIASASVGRIAIIGGIIYALAVSACAGSWLYLVENMINGNTVSIEDFKYSFKPYFVRVINVNFYLWLVLMVYDLVIAKILGTLPYGGIINSIVYVCIWVLLNPLPELIYQTYHSEIQLFGDSFQFIKENFPEWMIPNVIFGALLYYLSSGNLTFIFNFNAISILKLALSLILFMFVMIYRGILFRFLNESSRRSRLFKLQMMKWMK